MQNITKDLVPQKQQKTRLRQVYKQKREQLSPLQKKQKSQKINQLFRQLPFFDTLTEDGLKRDLKGGLKPTKKPKKWLAIYKALKNEPDLSALEQSLLKDQLCYPVIKGGGLKFYSKPALNPADNPKPQPSPAINPKPSDETSPKLADNPSDNPHLEPSDDNSFKARADSSLKQNWVQNRFQIEEPLGGQAVPLQDIFVFCVPGICFDRKGGRLGQGLAYYDKTLALCKKQEESSFLKKSPWFVGVAFKEQIHNADLPLEDHDIAMDLLLTDSFILAPLNKKKER